MVPFRKMHGLGNDFVVLDARGPGLVPDARGSGPAGEAAIGAPLLPAEVTPARAAALADRRSGIGCDQVIVLEPGGQGADAFMRIRNPDGSEAGACGNATRCVADLLARAGTGDRVVIRTVAGDLAAEALPDGRYRVDMGPARTGWAEIPLAHEADTLLLPLPGHGYGAAAACSMGNPHATLFVPDLAAVPVARLGPLLEHDPVFPERANIGFAQVLGADRMRLAVWERGAGLTLACGSGACAAVVNAARRGLTGRRVLVELARGTLEIEWREDGRVLMTGPAATAYTGEVDLRALPA